MADEFPDVDPSREAELIAIQEDLCARVKKVLEEDKEIQELTQLLTERTNQMQRVQMDSRAFMLFRHMSLNSAVQISLMEIMSETLNPVLFNKEVLNSG